MERVKMTKKGAVANPFLDQVEIWEKAGWTRDDTPKKPTKTKQDTPPVGRFRANTGNSEILNGNT